MNEQVFASQIRRALDESTARLPYRVTQRLETSRLAALARARPPAVPQRLSHPSSDRDATASDRPSVSFRLLATLVPLLLVTLALYGIVLWGDARTVIETAEIDAELLLSDDGVPIAAYADQGFGVYIRNVRQ